MLDRGEIHVEDDMERSKERTGGFRDSLNIIKSSGFGRKIVLGNIIISLSDG